MPSSEFPPTGKLDQISGRLSQNDTGSGATSAKSSYRKLAGLDGFVILKVLESLGFGGWELEALQRLLEVDAVCPFFD